MNNIIKITELTDIQQLIDGLQSMKNEFGNLPILALYGEKTLSPYVLKIAKVNNGRIVGVIKLKEIQSSEIN
jgi:hypothetical protein